MQSEVKLNPIDMYNKHPLIYYRIEAKMNSTLTKLTYFRLFNINCLLTVNCSWKKANLSLGLLGHIRRKVAIYNPNLHAKKGTQGIVIMGHVKGLNKQWVLLFAWVWKKTFNGKGLDKKGWIENGGIMQCFDTNRYLHIDAYYVNQTIKVALDFHFPLQRTGKERRSCWPWP